MKSYRTAALALLLAVPALPVFAAVSILVHSPDWSATYVAAYQSTFGPRGVPFTGTMSLRFNHGIISGTYIANSVRPDPLNGRRVLVSGGVSHGQIHLTFQAPANFTVRGTLGENAEISGSTTINRRVFSFMAKVKSVP
jgi:hypothetical protein